VIGEREALCEPVGTAIAVEPRGARREVELLVAAGFFETSGLRGEMAQGDLV
jgi:hypothetical protein